MVGHVLIDAPKTPTRPTVHWCAGPTGNEIVGSYHGLEAWTIYAVGLTDRDEQVMVSVHARLHHELQHTTPWGLLTRFVANLARCDIDPVAPFPELAVRQ